MVSSSFSDLEWAMAVAIFAVGGMIGSLLAGILADLIGRKWAMMCNNVVAVIAVGLQSLAVHPVMFISGRLVIGLNAGYLHVHVHLHVQPWCFHVDNKNPLYFARTYVYMRRNCIAKMRAIARLVFLKITVKQSHAHIVISL